MAIGILGIIFQYQTLWLAIIGGILRMIAETALSHRTTENSSTRPLQEVMIPRDRMVTLAHDTPPTRAARPVSSLRVPSLPHRRTRADHRIGVLQRRAHRPQVARSERNDHHPVHSQLVLRSNRAPGSHFTTGARCDAPQRFGSAVGVCGWDVCRNGDTLDDRPSPRRNRRSGLGPTLTRQREGFPIWGLLTAGVGNFTWT